MPTSRRMRLSEEKRPDQKWSITDIFDPDILLMISTTICIAKFNPFNYKQGLWGKLLFLQQKQVCSIVMWDAEWP